MFARWVAARREWNRLADSYADLDGPEMLVLEDEETALFKKMIATKAQTLEGLRCQITLLWEECGPEFFAGSNGSTSERHDPALRLKARILLGVESLTRATSWQPINPKFLQASQF